LVRKVQTRHLPSAAHTERSGGVQLDIIYEKRQTIEINRTVDVYEHFQMNLNFNLKRTIGLARTSKLKAT